MLHDTSPCKRNSIWNATWHKSLLKLPGWICIVTDYIPLHLDKDIKKLTNNNTIILAFFVYGNMGNVSILKYISNGTKNNWRDYVLTTMQLNTKFNVLHAGSQTRCKVHQHEQY